ncbi:MAG: hypothetical protein K2Y27_07000 [Xanthobacteraceae bacterium]|nr:hypothetical protein [Xanthobacteraceae bacterium]
MSSLRIQRGFQVAVILAAPLIGGCSGSSISDLSFSSKDKAAASTGDPNAFPADYKQELAAFLRTYIDNPRLVRDAAIGTPVLRPVSGQPRYVTCVRYNPRNFENKYEGNREKLVIFLGGRMNQFLESDPQICPSLAYQRYPEIENMVP